MKNSYCDYRKKRRDGTYHCKLNDHDCTHTPENKCIHVYDLTFSGEVAKGKLLVDIVADDMISKIFKKISKIFSKKG